MHRRGFLSLLGSAAVGLALDPEQLLWRPGQKTIFLPPAKPSLWSSMALQIGDVFTIDGVYAVNPVTYRPIGYLQNFVITANANSGPIDRGLVYPPMVFDGAYINVHGVLAPNARVRPVECHA